MTNGNSNTIEELLTNYFAEEEITYVCSLCSSPDDDGFTKKVTINK